MTKQEYLLARALLRANGRYAMRWLSPSARERMEWLSCQLPDRLARRARDIGAGCDRRVAIVLSSDVWRF